MAAVEESLVNYSLHLNFGRAVRGEREREKSSFEFQKPEKEESRASRSGEMGTDLLWCTQLHLSALMKSTVHIGKCVRHINASDLIP